MKAILNNVMFVCLCNAVTDTEVRSAIRNGANSVAEITRCTTAGACCGACRPTIHTILERERTNPARLASALIALGKKSVA